MAVGYYQLGGMTDFPQGNLVPYAVLTLGTTRLIAKGNLSGDEWRFGGTLGEASRLLGKAWSVSSWMAACCGPPGIQAVRSGAEPVGAPSASRAMPSRRVCSRRVCS